MRDVLRRHWYCSSHQHLMGRGACAPTVRFAASCVQVPSTTIVTNGEYYYFLRFFQLPKPRVVKSPSWKVNIRQDSTRADLLRDVENLVRMIVGVLELQKKVVDDKLGAKLARLEKV